MTKKSRLEATVALWEFIVAVKELEKKHGASLSSCGCCGGTSAHFEQQMDLIEMFGLKEAKKKLKEAKEQLSSHE